MKKIQLKKFNLSNAELLSKEQMKNVLGKMMGGSDDGGGCKDACEAGTRCYISGPNGQILEGSCKGWENCNGTDGKVYPVRVCE